MHNRDCYDYAYFTKMINPKQYSYWIQQDNTLGFVISNIFLYPVYSESSIWEPVAACQGKS